MFELRGLYNDTPVVLCLQLYPNLGGWYGNVTSKENVCAYLYACKYFYHISLTQHCWEILMATISIIINLCAKIVFYISYLFIFSLCNKVIYRG